MVNQSLKEKDMLLEERVVGETFRKLSSLNKKSRPKKINLCGSNPANLVRVMLALQDRFKKIRYNPDIFIQDPKDGQYSIDVRLSLKRSFVREFIEHEVVPRYNAPHGYQDLEEWAGNYTGRFKRHLSKIMDYINQRNSRADSRFLPSISDYEVDCLLDAAVLIKTKN